MILRFFRAVRHLWRSSVTGRFVSRGFAKANPDTTQQETMRDEGDDL
jgi:hypothetical protein